MKNGDFHSYVSLPEGSRGDYPQMAQNFRWVKYDNLPRYIRCLSVLKRINPMEPWRTHHSIDNFLIDIVSNDIDNPMDKSNG